MEFPADFFQEETRCDFVISSMMKRAWAVQMEVLSIVADLCEKNGLQYFAEAGTLLGAVRHQGFIPWDDDIDIALKREDYNELIRILPENLPYGFKLGGVFVPPASQDGAFPGFHSRVVTDSSVWGLKEHLDRFYGFPYPGNGIDIYAYDYLPRDREQEELQEIILEYGRALFFEKWGKPLSDDESQCWLQKMEDLCGVSIPREGNIRWNLQKLLDAMAGLFGEEESDEMTVMLGICRAKRGRAYRVKKECLESVIYLPFESMQIAVPVGWHELLVATFGPDYMTFEKGVAGHEYPCYAPEEKKLLHIIRDLGFEDSVDEFCQKVSDGQISVQLM